MRIGYLHVDYGEWTNGSYNTQEIGLAKAFEKLGHETIIFYWVSKKSEQCFTEVQITEKVKKVYLPTFHFKHHVMFNVDLLKNYNLDLIHVQSDNLLFVPNVVRFCKKNNIKYYCYVGTINSTNPNPMYRKFIDILVRRNIPSYKKSKVLVKTPRMKEELNKKGVKDITVAPVGLDLSIIPDIDVDRKILKKQLNIPCEKKIVSCVCRLDPDKQPMDFFKLIPLLDDSYYFIFIGNGILKDKFLNSIQQSKLENKIRYIEKIPNSEIHKYYAISDFVVNFNDNEIFGMSILEAMFHECTVVAKKGYGPKFIIEDGKSGYVVESIEKMADVIKRNVKTGTEGKKRVVDHFTWDITAQLIDNIYFRD